jgi:hypothetical protein
MGEISRSASNLVTRLLEGFLGMLCVSHSGRVHELLNNSEKAIISPVFEENVAGFLCLRFSIARTNDLLVDYRNICF